MCICRGESQSFAGILQALHVMLVRDPELGAVWSLTIQSGALVGGFGIRSTAVLNCGGQETRLTARASDRKGNRGIIGEIISKRMACVIKELSGKEERQLHFESKDCATNLAKRVDSQKEADFNRRQQH